MKILITHEIFSPEGHCDEKTVVYSLAEELIRKGHKVEVLTSGNRRINQYKGIKTRILNLPSLYKLKGN